MTRMVGICSLVILWLFCGVRHAQAELRIGTAKVDVTPDRLPVLVNGSMTSRMESRVTTRVSARAIVIENQQERIALVVVDSCLMPRTLLDEVKQVASARTGIPASKMMISATHTHTAPSVMAALGTDADSNYVPVLKRRLVEAIELASKETMPTQVGWANGNAADFTALRRWVRRKDRIEVDPFGNRTVRANMHAARNLQNVVGESGPEDPELSMICFRAPDGPMQAVLANFSMHYFGDQNISADYYGRFCDAIESRLQDGSPNSQPLAMMSHGCSGDIWRRDYAPAAHDTTDDIDEYTRGIVDIAIKAMDRAKFTSNSTLAMRQAEIPLRYRVPDDQRLAWGKRVTEELAGRLPESRPEIYGREQVYLHELQSTQVIVQSMRIGDVAIATTPTETYALTGLKLKHQSPFEKTMVIELANGGDGYIPPPEQHRLGGYNTWAARSAGLETTAEPKIVARLLGLMEEVTKSPRRIYRQKYGQLATETLAANPVGYFRLNELTGAVAANELAGRPALIERGGLYFLEGDPRKFTLGEVNRSLHVVDSRLSWQPAQQLGEYTVLLSFRNGMPLEQRDVTGWLFSFDHAWATSQNGLHLGIVRDGNLAVQIGDHIQVAEQKPIERWRWHRVCLRCRKGQLDVFLDDANAPIISAQLGQAAGCGQMFFGGRSDLADGLEGRLDEVVVFDRPLDHREISRLLGKPPE